MVLATGIIRAIVLAQPTVRVDVLASTENAAVVDGNPHVSNVITVSKRRPWTLVAALLRIRRVRYDAVLDGMIFSASLTNMLLMWLSRARHRIGVAGRRNDYALTLPVARVQDAAHFIDQCAALLAPFGVDLERISREAALTARAAPPGACAWTPSAGWGIWRPQIHLSPSEVEQGEAIWPVAGGLTIRLVVNVSAGSPARKWPEDCFNAALARLKERSPRVQPLLVGAPEDKERMARIAAAAGVPVAQTPHYRQMMAIVAAADLVLTADTSVTHVASAFGKPVVVMFANGEGAIFGPYTGGYAISTRAATLESLEVEPVMQALEAAVLAVSTAAGQGNTGYRAQQQGQGA
jgi:ADP-heptose:LPS heptosyltransferase